MKTENTCRLGNDFPFVSFSSTGGMSNFSYGLGALMIFRTTESPTRTLPERVSPARATIFVCKQHEKIERIHAEYQCCQHMVQTCHTLCTLRIAPKRFCNFDILFFCHNEKSYPSHLSFTSDHCKHSPDKNKEIRHIKNNSLKPFRSDLKPHIIHNMMLCIAVV